MTPKAAVLASIPNARLDYYESLRAAGKPCWFIRVGQQGQPISEIVSCTWGAWKDAALRLPDTKKALRREARRQENELARRKQIRAEHDGLRFREERRKAAR